VNVVVVAMELMALLDGAIVKGVNGLVDAMVKKV